MNKRRKERKTFTKPPEIMQMHTDTHMQYKPSHSVLHTAMAITYKRHVLKTLYTGISFRLDRNKETKFHTWCRRRGRVSIEKSEVIHEFSSSSILSRSVDHLGISGAYQHKKSLPIDHCPTLGYKL